jgi:hypothetical protein
VSLGRHFQGQHHADLLFAVQHNISPAPFTIYMLRACSSYNSRSIEIEREEKNPFKLHDVRFKKKKLVFHFCWAFYLFDFKLGLFFSKCHEIA